MAANRRRDTGPELAVRSLLHAAGLRFRVDLPVRIEGARAIRPDIVFPRRRIAIFVDGCFWHGCPEHGTLPATNVDYWVPKIHANRCRDACHDERLSGAGWTVLRAWEHEEPKAVAARIIAAVRAADSPVPRGWTPDG